MLNLENSLGDGLVTCGKWDVVGMWGVLPHSATAFQVTRGSEPLPHPAGHLAWVGSCFQPHPSSPGGRIQSPTLPNHNT